MAAAPSDTAGVAVVSAVAAAILATIFLLARRSNVTSVNVLDEIDIDIDIEPQQPVLVA